MAVHGCIAIYEAADTLSAIDEWNG